MKKIFKCMIAAAIVALGAISCNKETEEEITLSVSPTTLSLETGTSGSVTATVTPSGTTVTWSSSDETVATVSNGSVKAVKAGTATITATAGNKTATCKVTVYDPEIQYSITLNPVTLTLEVNETATITAEVEPAGTPISWGSTNEEVVTVKDGVVTAVGAGTASVTATAGTANAQCAITVNTPIEYTITIAPDAATLFLGETLTISAEVSPQGAEIKWASSDESVATVANGVVTPVAAGTVTITATAGDKQAEATIVVEEKGEGIIVDLCDAVINNGAWETTGIASADTKEKTQGVASVSVDFTEGDQVQILFQKPFEKPIDASSIDKDKAVLSMDVWFEDVSKLKIDGNIEASQFEISSNTKADQDEVSWSVADWDIKNGWNHLELRFKGAKSDGAINMGEIRRIRWYHAAKIGTTTIKLDNVRILEREPVIEEKPSDPDAIYIGHCENTDGWDNVTFTVDSENHQEGKGCLSTSVTGNFVWIYNLTEAVDCSKYTKATGMLSLDLYVSNAAAMKLTEGNGEIEFSSTAKDDDHEFNWNIATLSLVDGWNHLDLPFSAAGISGEAPDLSSILHMRIYHVGWTADGPVTVKLDNIRVRQRPETTVMLYNCDDKGNWDGMAGVDTGDKTEGTGSLWWMNGAGWVMQNNLATPVNASAISVESGILSFDLWCESIADCKWNEGSGELEIGSTTSNDQQELAWNVSDIGAQVTQAKAWNHIDLKLSDAKKVGGNINMANIARIRFFHVSFTMDNNIQMKIDNIRLRD